MNKKKTDNIGDRLKKISQKLNKTLCLDQSGIDDPYIVISYWHRPKGGCQLWLSTFKYDKKVSDLLEITDVIDKPSLNAAVKELERKFALYLKKKIVNVKKPSEVLIKDGFKYLLVEDD